MSGTSADYEGIKSVVMARLPGVDPTLVDSEARWLLNDFLRETRIWQRTFNITLLPSLSSYALALDTTVEVAFLLLWARINNAPLDLGTVSESGDTGMPTVANLPTDRTVGVYPTPTLTENGVIMSVRCALTVPPHLSTVVLPEVVRPYHNIIVDGLLARMYFMPDKPWTNTRMADPYLRSYRADIARTRREVDVGRTFGSLRMQSPTRFGV